MSSSSSSKAHLKSAAVDIEVKFTTVKTTQLQQLQNCQARAKHERCQLAAVIFKRRRRREELLLSILALSSERKTYWQTTLATTLASRFSHCSQKERLWNWKAATAAKSHQLLSRVPLCAKEVFCLFTHSASEKWVERPPTSDLQIKFDLRCRRTVCVLAFPLFL